jgi:hypothetical protein
MKPAIRCQHETTKDHLENGRLETLMSYHLTELMNLEAAVCLVKMEAKTTRNDDSPPNFSTLECDEDVSAELEWCKGNRLVLWLCKFWGNDLRVRLKLLEGSNAL